MSMAKRISKRFNRTIDCGHGAECLCGYGRNVENIRAGATRVIRGTVPMQVRRELSRAVKDGVLGRVPKDGLRPEIYFHPSHENGAIERQKSEAQHAVKSIASVMCTPADVRNGIEAMGGNVLEQVLSERTAKAVHHA